VLRQLRKLAAGEFQEFPHLVVNVCSARSGGAVSSESAAGKCRTPSLRRQQLDLFAQGLILPVDL
jgi:hypothetical protein